MQHAVALRVGPARSCTRPRQPVRAHVRMRAPRRVPDDRDTTADGVRNASADSPAVDFQSFLTTLTRPERPWLIESTEQRQSLDG